MNSEELTHQKFIENPFGTGKIYKTGDLGRWRTDGTIQFVGRSDDQVKIRGYRIEIGEIEQVLASLEEVRQAVVLVEENGNEKGLAAYITMEKEQTVSDLRSQLKEFLPDYMLPDYFVQLESFPLSRSGKIDRIALAEIKGQKLSVNKEYVPAKNEVEKQLVSIWERVLDRQNIGVTDSFFDLGGNSLKAMNVIFSIQKELNFKLDIERIFANPTIENIALEIENSRWLIQSKDKNQAQKIII